MSEESPSTQRSQTAEPHAAGAPTAAPQAVGALESAKDHLGLFAEFWYFMKHEKKWWLGPIIAVLLLVGLLVVFTQGSALAPFIYTIF